MTFEFLIAWHMTSDSDIEDMRRFLAEILASILDYYQNDFDDDMIQIHHRRPFDQAPADSGNTLIGFALELPKDTTDIETVIFDFVRNLQDNPSVLHVVKFEDPLLRAKLAEHASELFVLEMKLRRVLSLIYLNAYELKDPFNLIREEIVQIQEREKPTEEQMKLSSENQFFHITFSQYINLNKRRLPATMSDILNMIRDSEQYDVLREQMTRSPIANKRDTDLLNDLKTLMDPIERMRNCVAHNREPSTKIKENYSTTHPRVDELLDNYLADWGGP